MSSQGLLVVRAVLETLVAATVAVALAMVYGARERERIERQSDGYGDPDGNTITEVMQVLIGTGAFVGLCLVALAIEFVLWRRRRSLA